LDQSLTIPNVASVANLDADDVLDSRWSDQSSAQVLGTFRIDSWSSATLKVRRESASKELQSARRFAQHSQPAIERELVHLRQVEGIVEEKLKSAAKRDKPFLDAERHSILLRIAEFVRQLESIKTTFRLAKWLLRALIRYGQQPSATRCTFLMHTSWFSYHANIPPPNFRQAQLVGTSF
jgi:hypothetical protein